MSPENELFSSLRDQIADQLRKDIYSGRLVAGERIYQAELVKRFKISRTPVRDALALLIQEGLLEAMPNRGVRVAPHKSEEIVKTTYSVRRIIEIAALKSCFEGLTEADFLIWDLIIARMHEASEKQDPTTLSELDYEFHSVLIKRAGIHDFELIWKITASGLLTNSLYRFLSTTEQYRDPKVTYAAHVAPLKAFRGDDLDTAIECLSSHFDFWKNP